MDSLNNSDLIPDEYSMREYVKNRYSSNLLSFEKFNNMWLNRKHVVFWRGSTTGRAGKWINTVKDLEELTIKPHS